MRCIGARRAANKATEKLVRDLLERPIPAEMIAWMLAGMPESEPPVSIGDQVIFSAY